MTETHVFWSPHTDDETIGMGGSIARAVASGAHVCLVLVTDNRPSERGKALFPEHESRLAFERMDEWQAAADALGVRDRRALGIPETLMFEHRRKAHDQIVDAMRWLHREFQGGDRRTIVHHAVVGEQDPHAETGTGTLAHRICEDAARSFAPIYDETCVVLHKVYVYSHPIARRSAPVIERLTVDEMAAKRLAIAAYKLGPSSIGYGYASVPELFEGAETDPREFMERL